jgi:hypothetical protein
VGFLAPFANIGSLFLAPLLLEGTNGLSPAAAGLVLAPGAVAVAVLSPFAGKLSDGLGPRTVLLVGLAFMLVSALVVSSFAVGASPYVVAGGLLLLGIGYAGTNSPAANAASEAIPSQVAGTGLGIYQLFFFLGSGSGPAVLGAFLAPGTERLAGRLIRSTHSRPPRSPTPSCCRRWPCRWPCWLRPRSTANRKRKSRAGASPCTDETPYSYAPAAATWQAARWSGDSSSRAGTSPRQRGSWELASPERSTGQRG